ncbi:MAG: MBL fold metallo-hydrolase [Oscillospiraceae bacterium]
MTDRKGHNITFASGYRRFLAALTGAVLLLCTSCEHLDISGLPEFHSFSPEPPAVSSGTTPAPTAEPAPGQTVEPVTVQTTEPAAEQNTSVPAPTEEPAFTAETPEATGILKVHFIDVGQGDSCFIELPNGETMLIDAGEREYGDAVVTYIYEQGYGGLDYVVATHPHSDHIGGLEEVLTTLPAGGLYLPPDHADTTVYENMLSAAESSSVPLKEVMAGDVILSDGDLTAEVVAPKEPDEDNSNNNSVVIKLTFGETVFIFTGDAEKKEEDGIWTNIKCDVLKVGHHGSKTSTSANFLKKTEPEYAVISCGPGNSYGHPTDAVLKRLDKKGIRVFRTDIQGTVVFTSDGTELSVNLDPIPYIAETQE